MKTTQGNMSLSVLTLAVRAALVTMVAMPLAAFADDPASTADQSMLDTVTAADLINPNNFIEIEGLYTTKDSAKFGEYNGLDKKGFLFNSNLSIKGGDSYGQNLGTKRWSITGFELGTTSRDIGATFSDQGKWSIGIDYDQLRHNITDSYQTPYQGAMGGNNFTLPVTDGVINTGGNGTRDLSAWHGVFRQVDVYSQRENTSLTAGYHINRQWSVKFDWKHTDQSGAKLIGAGSDATTLDAIAYGGERIAILMNPTKYKTDNINLALNWSGERGYFSGGYYGSLFHDDYKGVSWNNPFCSGATCPATGDPVGGANGFPVDTMSTPPSNQFHQLNLSGGYFFSPATKLVGGFSYAHNTQNEGYDGTYSVNPAATVNPYTYLSGPSSLDGKVDIWHADLTLNHQATDALNLSAGVKYNERDNKTASYAYTFLNLGGEENIAVNSPESYRHTQFELAGNYRINTKQHLHAAYEYDDMKRWCDGVNTTAALTGSANASLPCMQVPQDRTDKFSLDYRLRATDTLNFKAGYAYSNRRADVNNPAAGALSGFYNPMQTSANTEGYEAYGYLAFFDASRKENQGTLRVDWQATDRLSVGLSGKYAKDDYDPTLGVQKGTVGSINLDASYNVTDNSTVAAYATWQRRSRDLKSAGQRPPTTPTEIWDNSLTDRDLTLGISGQQKGLMGNRLQLMEDFTYSLGKTDYNTSQEGTPFYQCSGTQNLGCGPLPTIKSEMYQIKLTGSYKVDKASMVTLGYLYQHLNSNDFFYNLYQYGYTASTLLPTNQVAPSYNQNVVFAAYSYNFK